MDRVVAYSREKATYESFRTYLYNGFEALTWYEQQRLCAVDTTVVYREQCAEAKGVAVDESVYSWAFGELYRIFRYCWAHYCMGADAPESLSDAMQ